jgi:hypothetical protein
MIDYYRFPKLRSSWGGALNGQEHRQKIVETFISRLPLDAIVETGTFRGTTTSFFAALTSLPIYTVEYDPRAQGFGFMALRRFKNVHRFGGDSRQFLRRLTSEPSLRDKTILFYLDAHWGEDLPLSEELDIICNHWSRAVVLIDDFQVPDDAGYNYDDYGSGKVLNLDYIKPFVQRFGLRMFFPSLSSRKETGAKRGSVTLASEANLVKTLRMMPEVREWRLESS